MLLSAEKKSENDWLRALILILGSLQCYQFPYYSNLLMWAMHVPQ